MARNQEKAQSLLYRFRKAQAAELGVSSKGHAHRPKMVSSVTSIRECEKWRGDIMREISRKVTRIQDYGLTEYEIRDLNDDINQLQREKGNWERHIVSLGGANYRSAPQVMLDDQGNEVPGMRGYRYFGRAKDLPGVRELFQRTQDQEEQIESFRTQKYRRFQNQSGAYRGDHDEDDGALLHAESAAESTGWNEGWDRVKAALHVPADLEVPAIPRPQPEKLSAVLKPDTAEAAGEGKRKKGRSKSSKAPESKRTKTSGAADDTPSSMSETQAASLLSALDARELVMPKVAERRDIEAFLLAAKKKSLRKECAYPNASRVTHPADLG